MKSWRPKVHWWMGWIDRRPGLGLRTRRRRPARRCRAVTNVTCGIPLSFRHGPRGPQTAEYSLERMTRCARKGALRHIIGKRRSSAGRATALPAVGNGALELREGEVNRNDGNERDRQRQNRRAGHNELPG